jgi:hypothetical protein
MALPKPKSIFDEEHPVASTGVTYAYPQGFRNVLGIAFRAANKRGGRHVVMMRKTPKCAGSIEELEAAMQEDPNAPPVVDDENDSIIDKVAEFARDLRDWLDENTVLVEDRGVLYAHGDVPLRDLDVPEYEETLEMSGKYTVRGGIKQLEVDYGGRSPMQGEPLSYYHIHITVNKWECVPVIMGKNWR